MRREGHVKLCFMLGECIFFMTRSTRREILTDKMKPDCMKIAKEKGNGKSRSNLSDSGCIVMRDTVSGKEAGFCL